MEKMKMEQSSYKKFAITMVISFIIMYGVMFLNVFDTSHIYLSINRGYMALLMVSPMALIMISMMGSMFKSKRLNGVIVGSAIIIFILALSGLRNQALVGDVQYMKGMIPHHSSAILTSTHANIKDPEVRKLADGIIAAQEKEIAEMKAILERLEKINRNIAVGKN